jgi:hypothetical protein
MRKCSGRCGPVLAFVHSNTVERVGGDAHFYTDRARAFADLGLKPDTGS